VAGFDDARGLGEVVDDASGARYPFHCIDIADGSRSVPVGVSVVFDVRPKLGRLEAVRITAV
jgi:hypothetical protein